MNPRRVRSAGQGWLSGLIATVLAVAFLGGAAVDAYGLHRCPHHDGVPAQANAGAAEAHAHATDASSDGHGSEDHGACTCIGLCGAATAALPAVGGTFRVTPPSMVPAARAALHVLLPVPTDYLIPFATAPPFAR